MGPFLAHHRIRQFIHRMCTPRLLQPVGGIAAAADTGGPKPDCLVLGAAGAAEGMGPAQAWGVLSAS